MAPRTPPTAATCAAVGRWLAGDDHGLSSRTMAGHLLGGKISKNDVHHPYDPSDLGRCLRLLDKVPEWRARVPEMATLSPAWAALVAHWDQLEALMDAEVGIDWSKGDKAPQTYTLMKQILAQARAGEVLRTTPDAAASRLAQGLAAQAGHASAGAPPPQDP